MMDITETEDIQNDTELTNLNEVKDSIVADWINKFKFEALSYFDFLSVWQEWVGKAFEPKKNIVSYDPGLNQSILERVLIQSLEDFILCSEKDKCNSFSENNLSSSVCGKIFKNGEVLFHCNDCAMDPTCVLCINCFKKSAHKNHAYHIGSSSGGGCCDCGDEFSWKTEPYCEDHFKALSSGTVNTFSEDLTSRLRLVISSILQYCYEATALDEVSFYTSVNPNYTEVTHCVVLYDDDIHTSGDVVDLLTKIINCSQSEAFTITNYTAEVGRVILKYSTFESCASLYHAAKQGLPQIDVRINQWSQLSNQEFALHLLGWLEKLIRPTKHFRDTFTLEALNLDNQSKSAQTFKKKTISVIEGVLLTDYKLWKSAQVKWHNILLSGMLLDHENKVSFAEKYLDQYLLIAENNAKTQYRALSLNNLSVQVLTVPLISHHLILQKNVLTIFMKTFQSEYAKCNQNFDPSNFLSISAPINGLLSILSDVKFILGALPMEWSHTLRKAFLSAMAVALQILSSMHNRYFKREIGAVYGPNFLYELKLQSELLAVLDKLVNWCATDQVVLLKLFKMASRALSTANKLAMKENVVIKVNHLAGHSAECLEYKVPPKTITFFLPLCRFFTVVYIHLQTYSFDFNTPDFNSLIKPSPKELLEPILQIQVLIAQNHAGILINKNELPLESLINYYKNSKLREKNFDRDIALLQIGTTLIDGNTLLIQMLHKYDLLLWADEHFEFEGLQEKRIREIHYLAEEFLLLLIIIIGERHKIGIGEVSHLECVKHEILHMLFIRPHTHSELELALLKVVNGQPKINVEEFINDIATFEKPKGESKAGVYKVKSEFINKYNIFFHHYSENDKSSSEAEMRKLKKSTGSAEFFPPPHLCKLMPAFKSISSLLNCDIMLHVMALVLKRSLNPRTETFSELLLHEVLHLIGYALQEEGDDLNLKFVKSDEKWHIKSYLQKLLNSKIVTVHKELIQWILDMYKLISNKIEPDVNKEISDSSEISLDEMEKEKKAFQSRAAERKAAIMAQMSNLQKNFYKNYGDLITEACEEETKVIDKSTCQIPSLRTAMCILCKEEEMITLNGPAMILVAYMQTSSILNVNHLSAFSLPILDQSGMHIKSCGHEMHFNCWVKFIECKKISKRNHSRAEFNAIQQEYFCPLCKSLGNTILPLLPLMNLDSESQITFNEWLKGMENDNDSLNICRSAANNNSNHSDDSKQNKIFCNCKDCIELFTSGSLSEDSVEEKHLINKWENFIEKEISPDVTKAIGLFLSHLCSPLEKSTDDVFSASSAFLVWESSVYKIRTSELNLHFSRKPLFASLSSREEICTTNIIHLSTFYSVFKNPKGHYTATKAHKTILSLLLKSHESGESRIFDWECFQLFYCLTMTLNSYLNKSFTEGVSFNYNLFKIVLLLNFAQNMLLLNENTNCSIVTETETANDETECLNIIVKYFKDYDTVNTSEVWKILKEASMPFLKCCAMFYHYLKGVQPSQKLLEEQNITFENILNFLGMPFKCKDLLDSQEVFNIFKKWSQHPQVKESQVQELKHADKALYKNLIDLPEDYFELIESADKFHCLNCTEKGLTSQSLCLLCGTFMCTEIDCKKQEINGEPVESRIYHAKTCGRGTGLFLSLSTSSIYLLSLKPKRNCMILGPYTDIYGEPDNGLFRGRPLKLCKEKYFDLQRSWLSHNIPEMIHRNNASLVDNHYGDHFVWHLLE